MKINIFLIILIIIILFVFYIDVEHFTETKINILNLVLYNDNDDYYEMYKYSNEYYRKFNNVKTFYYKFSSDVNKITINGDFILIPGKETFIPGILDKTIKVFEYVNEQIDYDYIVRTNISSIVNFDLLTDYLKENPIDYGGTDVNNLDWIEAKDGITDKKYFGTTFVAGSNIILSKNTINKILEHKESIHYDIIDDVSIGILIKEKIPEVNAIKINNMFIVKGNENKIKDNISTTVAYRNKSGYKMDYDRISDINNIKNLTNELEKNFIFPYQKINQIYYINLDHRKDRRDQLTQELDKVGVPQNIITRIPAVYLPERGDLGCSFSHIKAMEEFVKSDHNVCIIFEDDFEFTKSKSEVISRLNEVLNKDFDVCMLSSYEIVLNDTDNSNIKKVISAQTASGYMVSKKFAQKLLDNFKYGAQKLEESYNEGKPNGPEYCVDQYWKKLQPESNWFMISPKLGKQRESYSDIQKGVVNYNL